MSQFDDKLRISTGIVYGFATHPALRKRYMEHLREHGDRESAACYVGVPLTTVDRWRREHAEFAQEEDTALAAFKMVIEDEIRRRAIEGVEEPRFSATGKVIGKVRRFSDTLLLAFARRHIPEYREVRQVAISGDVKVNHEHTLNVEELSPSQREALRTLMGEANEDLVVPKISLEPVRPAIEAKDAEVRDVEASPVADEEAEGEE